MTSHELKIKKLLLDLGITPEIKGYHYLTKAIEIKENANAANDLFNTSVSGVERDIRHATQRSYNSNSKLFFHIFTPAVLDAFNGKITNSCFIAMVTEYLSLQSIKESEVV